MTRLKQVSKRRWKARLMRGLWIPRLVIEGHSLTAPEGCKLVWHWEEDFIKVAHPFSIAYHPYHPDTVKRAWE